MKGESEGRERRERENVERDGREERDRGEEKRGREGEKGRGGGRENYMSETDSGKLIQIERESQVRKGEAVAQEF